jgi:hypothetical protein
MAQQDPVLKLYAQSGLRSVEDWASLGRIVQPGTAPRATAVSRGGSLVLFGRDQTASALKNPRAAAKAAEPPPTEPPAGQDNR